MLDLILIKSKFQECCNPKVNYKSYAYTTILFVLLYIFYLNDLSKNKFRYLLNPIFFSKYLNKHFSLNNSYNSNYSNNSNKCSIINTYYEQYYADIDGERYPKYISLYRNKTFDYTCINKSSNMKKILYWNSFFGDNSYGYGLGQIEPFKKMNCPITNCEAIFDNSRINEADMILVHMRDGFSMPTSRKKSQKWIFFLMESQVYSTDFSNLNGFFNGTLTFQLNSDFFTPYGFAFQFFWQKNNNFNEDKDYLADKNEFAAAVISNCGDNSRRLDLIRTLQRSIPVKIFGGCGLPCEDKLNCKRNIAKKYKFYFAFENSVCNDYITEKFFEILNYDIIPVVYGGGNYEAYVNQSH